MLILIPEKLLIFTNTNIDILVHNYYVHISFKTFLFLGTLYTKKAIHNWECFFPTFGWKLSSPKNLLPQILYILDVQWKWQNMILKIILKRFITSLLWMSTLIFKWVRVYYGFKFFISLHFFPLFYSLNIWYALPT